MTFCLQHPPYVKPANELAQCPAMTFDGKQYTRKPAEGGRCCKQHNK